MMPKVTLVYFDGDKLRDLIERAGMTATEVGAKARVSSGAVSKAMRGMATGRSTAARIIHAVQSTFDELLVEQPDPAAVRTSGAA